MESWKHNILYKSKQRKYITIMKKRKLLSYLSIFALALIYTNNNSGLPTTKDSLHLYEHTEEGQSVANDSIEENIQIPFCDLPPRN